jgi:uncharacterized membrane protein YeaQ/YmgE (transglycosylase-associated protein family)
MGIVACLGIGLVAGFLSSILVNRAGSGLARDLVLGVLGAALGAVAFNLYGHASVTGFTLYSALVETVGAVGVLFLFHALGGRRNI